MSPTEELSVALAAIPGVEATRSRFGSGNRPAWRVGGREFAHLHSATLLDLRLPRTVQSRLRADPRAHFRRRASQWVELEFRSEQDVDDLAALAREAAPSVQGRGSRRRRER